MNNKFSAILNFTELNCDFLNMLKGLINQSSKGVEIIIVSDTDDTSVAKLKKILGKTNRITFYNKNSQKDLFASLDSHCLLFCNEHNTLKYDALEQLYELYKKRKKDILVYNGSSLNTVSDNVFEYGDLDIYNTLFDTDFIKNSKVSIKELMDLAAPISLLRVMSGANVDIVEYNPFTEYMDFRKNKLFDWKRYLTSLDEFYKYIVENDLDDQYLKQFSDFFLKYVYELFCVKSDKELNQIIRFIESKIPSFMDIIKTKPLHAQYEIFKKYFGKRKKQQVKEFSNEINIATFCDEENASFLAVSLISLINQTSENNMYDIHILHKGLSAEVIRKLYGLSKENVNILFMDISGYMNSFNIDTDNIELIIPKIFCNLENVIYIRNNILFEFDINDFQKENIDTNYITGVNKEGETFNLQNIVMFFFNIKKCLEDRISEQLFLFCAQDTNGENYIGNYIRKSNNKYDFVYLACGEIDEDNIDNYPMIEWLNYSRKTAFYEWFLYSLFEKGIGNGRQL